MAVLGKLLSEGLEDASEKALTKAVKKGAKETGESILSKVASKVPVVADDIAENLADASAKLIKKNTPDYGELLSKSVLRDKGGKLVPVYHSSDAVFDKFDDAMLGSSTGYPNTAFGHFVTPDETFSKRFGKNTNEYYANIQKPIIHPYGAEIKYPDRKQLDDIVTKWLEATDNPEALANFKQYVDEGEFNDLYDAYMNSLFFDGTDPYEFSMDEKPLLKSKGYDAVEIIEGPRSSVIDDVVDDNTPVISYAVFNGDNLIKSADIPDEIKKELMDAGVEKYLPARKLGG